MEKLKGVKMKKLIAVSIAVIMVLALMLTAVPAFAASPISIGVGTSVTIGSSGTLPSVLAKWESDSSGYLEDGDVPHAVYFGVPSLNVANSQFLPPVTFNGIKTINYFAVVDDANGKGAIADVFAYVYSPANSPAPYNANPNAPSGVSGLFKYKVELTDTEVGVDSLTTSAAKQAVWTTAMNLYNAASAAHLITLGNNVGGGAVSSSFISTEIGQGYYHVYEGSANLTYEQPAGDYKVDMFVMNTSNATSAALENYFTYLPVPAFTADFTSISYGSVGLNQEKLVPGDTTWAPSNSTYPTLRNVGNVWVSPIVSQDDMGFGMNNVGTPNVTFDAKLGDVDTTTGIVSTEVDYPPQYRVTNTGEVATGQPAIILPNFIGLSMDEKIDFSILVTNTVPQKTSYSGTMTLGYSWVPFGTGGVGTAFGPIGVPSPGGS
jgi:hypothetical protein